MELGMVFTTLLPSLGRFADANSCSRSFLGLESWFHFLPASDFDGNTCNLVNFDALGSGSGFLLIAMAILDDLLKVAAYIAVGYVIYGGITYITSQGSPDQTKKAQQTIINALIGLATALIAAAIVSFIGTKLGG